MQHSPTSYAVVFLYVCAFEFYHIFEQIGHWLDLLIFTAFNIGPFGLWPTHCADSIVWSRRGISSYRLHRADCIVVRISLYRLHRADCIMRIVYADCIMRTVSCGLHCGALYCTHGILVRIASWCRLHRADIFCIPLCTFHRAHSILLHRAGVILLVRSSSLVRLACWANFRLLRGPFDSHLPALSRHSIFICLTWAGILEVRDGLKVRLTFFQVIFIWAIKRWNLTCVRALVSPSAIMSSVETYKSLIFLAATSSRI